MTVIHCYLKRENCSKVLKVFMNNFSYFAIHDILFLSLSSSKHCTSKLQN